MENWVVKFRAAVAQNELLFIYGPLRGAASETCLELYVTMEGVANIASATDQIEHDFVSDVLTDIEPETTRDYGGWLNWQVIYVVYEERSLDPPPLTLSTWSMKMIDMYWILVEELDARCRIHHFPPDVSYDRDTARRWWATIKIKVPEHEDSSFLTIQDDTLSQDDTPSMTF